MHARKLSALVLVVATSVGARAQQAPEGEESSFEKASVSVERQLEESVAELEALRDRLVQEKLPLDRKLADLEADLVAVTAEFQEATRLLDRGNLDVALLETDNTRDKADLDYLSTLLADYIREFESRLHIAELDRYEETVEAARLAPDNGNLSEEQTFAAQVDLLTLSLERLEEAIGGTRFEGTAVTGGVVSSGTFVLVGPAALFRSEDGKHVGTAEPRLGSLEPNVFGFSSPEDRVAAADVLTASAGLMPIDPTLGNAHAIEAADNETFFEHVQKGGPVMIPIFALAGLALLVALYRWFGLAFIPKPSKKKLAALLGAVARHDEEEARARAADIKGPVGRMLDAGVEHLKEPRDLIEEVMYETVLTTRLRLQRLLPFIAICAASAPLLGLLGTVTGIIDTFKMITVFGSGDVKLLSGGISEALITTKFGLIVAIPSLLLHAFLSRKARGVIGTMEIAAVSFVNEVSKSPFAAPSRTGRSGALTADPGHLRTQVQHVLEELLAPVIREELGQEDPVGTGRHGDTDSSGVSRREVVTEGRESAGVYLTVPGSSGAGGEA